MINDCRACHFSSIFDPNDDVTECAEKKKKLKTIKKKKTINDIYDVNNTQTSLAINFDIFARYSADVYDWDGKHGIFRTRIAVKTEI